MWRCWAVAGRLAMNCEALAGCDDGPGRGCCDLLEASGGYEREPSERSEKWLMFYWLNLSRVRCLLQLKGLVPKTMSLTGVIANSPPSCAGFEHSARVRSDRLSRTCDALRYYNRNPDLNELSTAQPAALLGDGRQVDGAALAEALIAASSSSQARHPQLSQCLAQLPCRLSRDTPYSPSSFFL